MSNYNLSKINNVCVYYRVSTPGQANDERFGLDKQTDKCEYYSKNIFKKNENQINYYCDIGSTYNNKCVLKQQNVMIRDIQYGSVILVHDVSRLGRNIEQVFKLLKKVKAKDSYIISIEDNVCYGKTRLLDKKFWYKIIESEESSDKKSNRMTRHINMIRELGGHVGGVPYGYIVQKMNDVPRLAKNAVEQNAIKLIKSMVNKKTLWQIVTILRASYGKKRGKMWTLMNVKSINLSRSYKTYKLVKEPLIESIENLTV
jgi:DNA invertase Pin-like site-specific DNA recombinase